ncbi:MAG: peptidase S41, partial [Candidatus Eisenbacteria bacterium]
MNHRSILPLLLLALLAATATGEERTVRMAQHPALSPDGEWIAFAWRGDIWKVPAGGGEAIRLTVHPAGDHSPSWSPDGLRIAFVSERSGDYDVFVMSAGGGLPLRVTYHSGDDLEVSWHPDGERVIWTSSRASPPGRGPQTYIGRPGGGTPVRLIEAGATRPRLSPDGTRLAFERGGTSWWRKHYVGSAQGDVWLCDLPARTFRRLTDFDGNDREPLWAPDGSAMYVNSERDGTFNLWRIDVASGESRQITRHEDDGVRFPEIARNAPRIVYEQADRIVLLDLDGSEPRPVEIRAPMDSPSNPVERKTFTSDASEYAISPDGKEVALIVRGEVFVADTDGPGNSNLVGGHPARESEVVWTPEGEGLVFISDRDGQEELYEARPAQKDPEGLSHCLEWTLTRLTETPEAESSPQFSPDGTMLTFVRGPGNLWIRDWKSGEETLLLPGWDHPSYEWSPDSRWIACSREDNEFNSDVWILSAKDPSFAPVNVSRHPDDDRHPTWSSDGRILAFSSRRIAQHTDIWFVFLRKRDDEMSKEEMTRFFEDMKKRRPKTSTPGTKKEPPNDDRTGEDLTEEDEEEPKEEAPAFEVLIDFDGIHRRLRRLTSLPGDERGACISPVAGTFFFTSDHEQETDLYSIQWDG